MKGLSLCTANPRCSAAAVRLSKYVLILSGEWPFSAAWVSVKTSVSSDPSTGLQTVGATNFVVNGLALDSDTRVDRSPKASAAGVGTEALEFCIQDCGS